MLRRPRELSGPRELIQGATLGLPLRGLSCPGSEPRDIEPPVHGAFLTPDQDRRGARDGSGAMADPPAGGAARWPEMPTTGDGKPSASERPRRRERVLVAILGLALAVVLARAARRWTAIDNPISRRSR
jgi:hypothetical protein